MIQEGIGQVELESVGNVVAFDPGETTGFAVLRRAGDAGLHHWGRSYVRMGQAAVEYSRMRGVDSSGDPYRLLREQVEDEFVDELWDRVTGLGDITDVILEDFILRRPESTKSLLSPVRINQAIVSRLWQLIDARVWLQQPSDMKTSITCSYVGKFIEGITENGEMRHASDAARHLVLWCRKQGIPWH